MTTETTPHWEHGYRCHGYWIGLRIIGRVGLGPARVSSRADGYGCIYYHRDGRYTEWRCHTLAEGKKKIEAMFLQHG